MQQLENLAYESPRVSEGKQEVYQTDDLERLSATHLGYGKGGSSLGSPGAFGIVRTPLMDEKSLSIVDLPSLSVQIHIHEGAGGSANVKGYGSLKGEQISSYDAAMADYYAEGLGLKRISKQDKKERRGRT